MGFENIKELRNESISFFKEGLKSINPVELIHSHLALRNNILTCSNIRGVTKEYDLGKFKKVFIIGAGKATAKMAKAVEEILYDRISSGLIVTKYGFTTNLKKIILVEAGHPLPDENGVSGAAQIVDICNEATENDLIINLISGGASALLPNPTVNITLIDKIAATKILLEVGATIDEVNSIRKHLSQIKGGQLAKIVYPATVVSLILSDVIGDRLDTIGSGIIVPDRSTFNDCWEIMEKYKIIKSLPASVISHIQEGRDGIISETPKPGEEIFDKVDNLIVGNNSVILKCIKNIAERNGYNTKIVSFNLDGEAKEIGKKIAHDAIEFLQNNNVEKGTHCFLYGGETSVTIRGNGKGGRNQELILSAAMELNRIEGVSILSCGTDGNDGPTDAAGAICDGTTINRANKFSLNAKEYLENNDSYNFFNKVGDLIITDPTNTNVMDIQIVLISVK